MEKGLLVESNLCCWKVEILFIKTVYSYIKLSLEKWWLHFYSRNITANFVVIAFTREWPLLPRKRFPYNNIDYTSSTPYFGH